VASALLKLWPPTSVLDREIVILVNGQQSLDHLLIRPSRLREFVKKQAADFPALEVRLRHPGRRQLYFTGETLATRRAKFEQFADSYLDQAETFSAF